MRILIHLRSDYEAKPGGDISLARQYGSLLVKSGADVVFTGEAVCHDSSFDIALTFNLDRPFEPAKFVRSCKAKGVPVLLYALHHPVAGLRRYLRKGVSGFKGFIARMVLFNPDAYETCLNLIKVSIGKNKIDSLSDSAFVFSSIARRYLLNNVTRILVSNPLELIELSERFKVMDGRIDVLPHVLDVNLPEGRGIPRDIDVICAGRIECRKNQLTVVQLARFFPGLKFVFVGSSSPSEKSYFKRFAGEVSQLPNVDHIESLPLSELRTLFKRSHIFISLSWFEVVSLTEMEALASGCRLILGKYSYSKYYAGPLADVVEPADLQAAKDAIHACIAEMPVSNDSQSHSYSRLAEMKPDRIMVSFDRIFDSLKEMH